MSEAFGLPERIVDIHNHLRPTEDPEKFIALMDEHNVEAALVMGSPLVGEEGNRHLVKVCRKYAHRLVGGAYYDPREGKKATKALKHYSAEGLPVVKLFPNFGYFPDDETLRPFWDVVAELKMGVLSHCGWLGGSGEHVSREPWASYYSHPGRFEKVIRLYPDTIFIMAHMGGIAGVLESVMLSTRTANTFIDCSPGQGLWALEKGGTIAGSIPPGKLVWGADSKDYAGLIPRYKAALEKLGYGPHLEKVFRANGRGILEKLGFGVGTDQPGVQP